MSAPIFLFLECVDATVHSISAQDCQEFVILSRSSRSFLSNSSRFLVS